jgi:hypothetical protein
MNPLREAAQQALHAMTWPLFSSSWEAKHSAAINALRAALEKPEQEPVAYVSGYHAGRCVIETLNRAMVLPEGMALYTAPHRREWQGLTDEEINGIDLPESGTATVRDFVRIIETALKEKNT